jgi:ABC-type transport system substrate-binding protein
LGPDPAIGVERLYDSRNILSPPAPFTNSSGYKNPTIDQLFDQEKLQTDTAKRKQLLDQAQDILWNDVPCYGLYAYHGPNVVRGAKGIFSHPYGNQEPYETAELISGTGSSSSSSSSSLTGWVIGGVVVVAVAAGALLRLRNRTQRRPVRPAREEEE